MEKAWEKKEEIAQEYHSEARDDEENRYREGERKGRGPEERLARRDGRRGMRSNSVITTSTWRPRVPSSLCP